MNLGKNLKKLRCQKNMTVRELATKSSIHFTSISKIENEMLKNPTILTVIKISNALDVSIDELVNDK